MKPNYLLLILTILTLLFFGCSTSTSSKPNDSKPDNKSNVGVEIKNSDPAFPLPEIPLLITGTQEGAIYLSKHFWDLFPFTDTKLISQPDITEQGFVDYIQLLNDIPYDHVESSISIMLNKAKVKPEMYKHFVSLFEKYLYDPNSPFRNDELYIPVLDNTLKSGLLSETKQSVYSFQQEMILKNRLGSKATDFVYTLANGDKKTMHTLESDYLILFFTNPDCPTYASVTQEMSKSEVLKSIFSLNSSDKKLLTILSVYPDRDLDLWRKALPKMPQENWVNTYDAGTQITNKKLYDIKAIPTLYLLDKSKNIILKDTSLEEIEGYFMRVR